MSSTTKTVITFDAPLSVVRDTFILRLPPDASRDLHSRGQVSVRGTLNGRDFETVVEPDGMRGHWIRIPSELRKAAKLREDDQVSVAIAATPEWPEPDIPEDLAAALANAPVDVRERWRDITPMARWEWVRWVNATANPSTRERRVEVSISKLDDGKRRPCCFDLSACTDPLVAKSGKLVIDG